MGLLEQKRQGNRAQPRRQREGTFPCLPHNTAFATGNFQAPNFSVSVGVPSAHALINIAERQRLS